MQNSTVRQSVLITIFAITIGFASGCSTAPKVEDQATFLQDARSATQWFEGNVPGLHQQVQNAAGYIVFPDVAQWGIVLTGGTSGRGVVYNRYGQQIGWSKIGIASIGLQAGVTGFKMMLVLENDAVLSEFSENKWTGSVGAVAVAVESGGGGLASFTEGVAIYQGASAGLMAGVNIGLNKVKFEALGAQ